MPNFKGVGNVRTIKKGAGSFLELSKLISILPEDYFIHIKQGNEIMWEGIAWVFVYEGMGRRYNDYVVLGFEINYINTDIMISTALQYD